MPIIPAFVSYLSGTALAEMQELWARCMARKMILLQLEQISKR
ncbi:MAG TPA: hypothetical protein VG098_06365 [Nitrososphaera sp.]|nr:hypothetical protein [Nitrososphaera sp.]